MRASGHRSSAATGGAQRRKGWVELDSAAPQRETQVERDARNVQEARAAVASTSHVLQQRDVAQEANLHRRSTRLNERARDEEEISVSADEDDVANEDEHPLAEDADVVMDEQQSDANDHVNSRKRAARNGAHDEDDEDDDDDDDDAEVQEMEMDDQESAEAAEEQPSNPKNQMSTDDDDKDHDQYYEHKYDREKVGAKDKSGRNKKPTHNIKRKRINNGSAAQSRQNSSRSNEKSNSDQNETRELKQMVALLIDTVSDMKKKQKKSEQNVTFTAVPTARHTAPPTADITEVTLTPSKPIVTVKTHLPPQFDGQPNSNTNPESWIADVDAHFEALPDQTKVTKFATFLTGQANTWYHNLRKTNNVIIRSWALLMSAFIKHFNGPIPTSVAMSQLFLRGQKEDESITDFIAAFNDISSHLDMDYSDKVRVDLFYQNVSPSISVVMGTQHASMRSKMTLAETFVAAIAAENVLKGHKLSFEKESKKSDRSSLNDDYNTRRNFIPKDKRFNSYNNYYRSNQNQFDRDLNNRRRQPYDNYLKRAEGNNHNNNNSNTGNNYSGSSRFNQNNSNNNDSRNKRTNTRDRNGKDNITCYNCNQKGHYANECPQRRATMPGTAASSSNNPSDTKPYNNTARPLDTRDRHSANKSSYGHHVMVGANESNTQKNALTSPNEVIQSYQLRGSINDLDIVALIDTGAPISVISHAAYDKISSRIPSFNATDTQPVISGLDGNRVTISGHFDTAFIPSAAKHLSLYLRLYVVVEKIPLYECILGMDFINAHLANIIMNPPSFNFQAEKELYKFDLSPNHLTQTNRYQVYVSHKTSLNANSEITIRANIAKPYTFDVESSLLFSPVPLRCESIPIIMHSALIKPDKTMCVPVTMINLSKRCCTLNAGAVLGYLEPVEGIFAYMNDNEKSEPHDTSDDVIMTSSTNSDLLDFHTVFDDLNLNDSIVQTDPQLFERVKKLLLNNSDVFAKDNNSLGRTQLVQHTIDTGNTHPIKSVMFRQPYATQQTIQQHVDTMLKDRIVVPSDSPWSANVLIVRKKDGTERPVIDYRKLNAVTRKDAFPIPRTDDTLDAVAAATVSTTLDCLAGYWQVPMDPRDADKTAFSTTHGHYEFAVMPFGLTNAPATFQRLMNRVFAGLLNNFVLVYIDDIVVFSKTTEQHFEHLQIVFDRLRKAGLRLKIKKCKLFQTQIDFLGHTVSAKGIQPDSSKVKAILEWPRPTTVKELQSFLGIINYYRRFIKDLAKIASPLYQLTKKGREYTWTNECQSAFDTLRQALISEPIMRAPDMSKPFILITDASKTGLGAVLSQVNELDGRDHAISYISRTLTAAERNYSVTQLECLAVVWAVRTFRPYIHGQKFTIITDHSALRWLFGQPNPSGRLARWIESMMEHNYTVEYRRGTANGNADALSRMHNLIAVGVVQDASTNAEVKINNDYSDELIQFSLQQNNWYERFQLNQSKDDYCASITAYLHSQDLPKQLFPSHVVTASDRKKFSSEANNFFISDKLLYHVDSRTGNRGLFVPTLLRNDILKSMHDDTVAGHLGAKRTIQRLITRFYWRGMNADVHRHIEHCENCLKNKVSRHNGLIPSGSLPIPTQPFEFVAVDFLGPLPKTTQRNVSILVITDYLTRWAEAIALPNQQARTYASAFIERVVLRHGAPRVLLSDNAKDFTGVVASEIYELCKIRKIKTSAYHPQTNGLTERFNHTLVTMLRQYIDDHQTDWDVYLPYVMFAYCTAQQETVKHSPFYLLYGREPQMPIDAMLPVSVDNLFESPTKYVEEVQRRMHIAHNTVHKLLTTVQEKRAEENKQLNENKLKQFHIGDVVMKRVHQVPKGKSLKLASQWSGKYQVIDVLPNGNTYQIHPVDKQSRLNRRSISEVIHASQLKSIPHSLTPQIKNISLETELQTDTMSSQSLSASSTSLPTTPTRIPVTDNDISAHKNETSATHPDYREKLPPRMQKPSPTNSNNAVRRSSRPNIGQRTLSESFVDSRYLEFDDDIEFRDTKRQHEFDE